MPQLLSKKRLMVPTSLPQISMQEDTLAPGESCGCSEWVLICMARAPRAATAHVRGTLQVALKCEHLSWVPRVWQPDLSWSLQEAELETTTLVSQGGTGLPVTLVPVSWTLPCIWPTVTMEKSL